MTPGMAMRKLLDPRLSLLSLLRRRTMGGVAKSSLLWNDLHLAIVPAPRGSVLWLLFLLLATLVAWSCIGEIDVIAAAPGKLVPTGKVKLLQASEISIVRSIHAAEGQQVKTGELLVELDPTINEAELKAINEKLIQLRLESERLQAELEERDPVFNVPGALAESIAAQRALLDVRRQGHMARLSEAENNHHHRRMQEKAAAALLKKLEANYLSARERVDKIKPYVGQSIPYFEFLRLQDNANSLASELASQRATVEAVRQERLAADQRQSLLEADHRSSLFAQIQEKQALIVISTSEKARVAQLLAQKTLRSPVDGKVQSLSVNTLGGAVMPGQVIASIVPDHTPLLIEAALSSEDVGFVKEGQRVEIKVDAFPFQKYGTLSGVVTWISPDAESRTSGLSDSGGGTKGIEPTSLPLKGGLMYRLHIKPDRTPFVRNEQRHEIGIGMTVQADIVTGRRRIIEFFLSPILKNLDEGLRTR